MKVTSTLNRAQLEQIMDGQFRYVTESVTLEASDQVVHVSDADAAVVVTLPPVAEAAGNIYTIYTVEASGINGVDVIDQGDALYSTTRVGDTPTTVDVSAAVAIDAAGNFLCLYSNGISWITLAYNK